MKHFLIGVSFFASVCYSFGQTPSASLTGHSVRPPETSPTRNFGWSLKQYEKKSRAKTQAKSIEPDDDVIRVSTDLVVNDVLVSNQKGNVILGLQKEDFVVTEDGTPQTLGMFAPGESAKVPRSIVLIIDCLAQQAPFLKNSIAAAKILVDKLSQNDKMAIVTVDLKLQLDFTEDKIVLKKTLDSLERKNVEIWGGWQFRSLLAVLNEMFDEQDRQRIVVFQGSGNEMIWLKPDKDTPYQVSFSTLERSGLRYAKESSLPKFGFSEVKEAIERSRATVYSIIPGIRFLGFSKDEQLRRAKSSILETHKFFKGNKESDLPEIVEYDKYARAESMTAGQTAMYKVAEISGGFTSFIEKPEEAENVYSDIFTVIKNRYLIGYYPTNRTQDGKPREVRVQVRNHPEYTVTGRKSYLLQ
jgi:VWFA-related protein